MKCPYCFHDETKVVDKRETEDLDTTRRRRECLKCEKRFTTYERVESLDLVVIKKDGSREAFDREKIYHGILKACNKLPVTSEEVSSMADRIVQRVRNMEELEIKSNNIGRLVMKELLKINKVAYLRFASVCKEFDDPKHFEQELELIR